MFAIASLKLHVSTDMITSNLDCDCIVEIKMQVEFEDRCDMSTRRRRGWCDTIADCFMLLVIVGFNYFAQSSHHIVT